MINYGRGLWHIISQTREGRNILFPSFTFSFSLGGQVTSAQLEMGEGGVPRTPPPSPCRDSLTCPRPALPGLRVSFFSFFLLGLNFPAVAKAAQASTCPLSAASPSQPRRGTGCSQCPPRRGLDGPPGGGVMCVCVLPWPTHRALWQSEGAFAGCQAWGTKKENPGRVPQRRQQQRPGGGRPHLLAECRGNGGRRGPSSPRQSKQDRWARAWRD